MSTQEELGQVRQPPGGLSRKQRKAWFAAEGVRLANLRETAGDPLLASFRPPVAPRQLGRAGRRAWRETERDNRSQRLREAFAAEAASGESDRYVGAVALMGVVLIVVVLRVFGFGGSDDPAPVGPAPVALTPTASYYPPAPTTPSAAPQTWPGE